MYALLMMRLLHAFHTRKYWLTMLCSIILLTSFSTLAQGATGGTVVGTIPVGVSSNALVFNPSNGFIYEVDRGTLRDFNINLIFGASNIDTIPISSGGPSAYLQSLAFNPSNNDIYYGSEGSAAIHVISGKNQVGYIIDDDLISSLGYNPANSDMYVGHFRLNSVTLVSGNNIVGNVTTGNTQPECCGTALGFSSSNNYMYECRFSDSNVYVMSGTTLIGNVTRACGLTQPLEDLSSPGPLFNPSNKEMYALNPSSNSVSVISGATLVGNVTVGSSPSAIAFNPTNNEMYVANFDSNSISIISDTSVIDTIPVGSGPSAIAFNPTNNYMYVANYNDGTVSVISGTSVINTITVGSGPVALAFDPVNNYMYVANFAGGTMSVIQGSTPVDATQNLVKFVNSMNLSAGATQSLDSKLNEAISYLNSGDNANAKTELKAFITQVNGLQSSGTMTSDQASALDSSAQNTINSIP